MIRVKKNFINWSHKTNIIILLASNKIIEKHFNFYNVIPSLNSVIMKEEMRENFKYKINIIWNYTTIFLQLKQTF